MRKLTMEFIKSRFEKENYTLLSSDYKGCGYKLEYICPNNHMCSTTWSYWNCGKRCPYCYGNIKHDISFIKKSFEERGYTLLSKVYTNSRQKLEYECPNGHKHKITWINFKKGIGCPYCSNRAKPKINDIRAEFEREGYNLLSNYYCNGKAKLNYICPKGHKHSTVWNVWRLGHRCPSCGGTAKYTYQFIKTEFEKEGYTLLSREYVNCKTKIEYLCTVGHKHSVTFDKWNCNNRRCPTCAIIKHTGSGSPSWKGGISYEPYCPIWKDKEYKEDIKLRDGYKCLNPCCWKKDHRLHIHHIDYDKKNCSPHNLITVCRSCNTRANTERDWHETWYKAIMYRRHGYE